METCLEDELLQQLRIELSDPLDIRIGEMIIGSLNEDGYLNVICEEIAGVLGIDDLLSVEYILTVIQNFEPVGIASRDLKECLLSQVKLRCNGNSELVQKIVENHIDELGRKKFHEIAKKCGVHVETVKKAARLIALFEPRPARNYRPIKTSLYIRPDILIKKDENDQYHVEVNNDGIPPLRINGHYRRMLKKNNLGEKEKEFIREKLKNALFYIKSIEQRGTTIMRISEYILEKQKDFFDSGHQHLAPMTLKDIAQTIDRNESTISRAISNKYMDTPQGTFPLKFFFSQGISGTGSRAVTSRSIKEEIKELVESEEKASPLSDQDIQGYFRNKGTTIARRTISKYRQALRILPSHLRKI
ncbi:MAG: RNA polymerase factor sigma-54, partial [Candidatus Omnitrophica bacterium]|nr:RNA polymerase factor sigma-54 [Candidatus Omnitrophota bacterium]